MNLLSIMEADLKANLITALTISGNVGFVVAVLIGNRPGAAGQEAASETGIE